MSVQRRQRRKQQRLEKKFMDELRFKHFPGLTDEQIFDKLAELQIEKMNKIQIQEPINIENI